MNSGPNGNRSANGRHSIPMASALREEKVLAREARRETQRSRNIARRSVHDAYSIGDKQRQ